MNERLANNIDMVLADIRRVVVDERSQTHGDAGLFAHVFAGMLRPYIHGILSSGRGLQDLDAFNILSMMKLARQSVGGPVPFYEHSLDAAGYAVLRAAFLWEPGPDMNAPGNRSGEQLLAFAKGEFGENFSIEEKFQFPMDWTPEEKSRFIGAYYSDKFQRTMAEFEANNNAGLPPAYWAPEDSAPQTPGETTRQPVPDHPMNPVYEAAKRGDVKIDWEDHTPDLRPIADLPTELSTTTAAEPEKAQEAPQVIVGDREGPVDLDALADSLKAQGVKVSKNGRRNGDKVG